MSNPISEGKANKFTGGLVTAIDRVELESGAFSTLQNVDHRPFRKRKGAVEHNTSGTADDRIESLFQFSKARRTELRLFAQVWDNSGGNWIVVEMTNNPPTVGASFGTTRLTGITGVIPASWAVLNDLMLYIDKGRQGQYFTGQRYPIRRIMYYSFSAGPNISPDSGRDLTAELKDDGNVLEASVILDSANDKLYIGVQQKINRLYFDLGSTVNAAVVTLAVKYHNEGYLESAVSGLSDGTASGGATMAQDGGVSWDLPSTDQPVWMFGQHLYWYILEASGATDSFKIVSVTCELVDNADDSPAFGDFQNVWDGVPITAIEAHFYSARSGATFLSSGDNIFLGGMDTDDFLYFNLPFAAYGFFIDMGVTPHKNSADISGGTDIRFAANVDDTIADTISINGPRSWSALGFEAGMSIVVTNATTAGNNVTATITSLSGRVLSLKGNTLTTTEDGKASPATRVKYTGVLDLTTNTDTFSVYNDNGTWTGLGLISLDGTNNLQKSGYVLWDEKVVAFSEKPFGDSKFSSHWYRMKVNDQLVNSVNMGIQGLIYPVGDQLLGQAVASQDGMQASFGLARTAAAWKDRLALTFDYLPFYVYISAKGRFNVLNGGDFGIVRVGDGRYNPVLFMVQYYNELFCFQEEKGPKGGCVTVIEGNKPENYGTLVMSDDVGILNAKCGAMVDGVSVARFTGKGFTEEKLKLLFWLSRRGIFVTDGQVIYQIDKDVRNYFDPQEVNSLRLGYEDRHSLTYDKQREKIIIDMVIGTSATVPNVTLCYDIVTGKFSADTPAQPFSCRANIEAASGNEPVLQIAGGTADGKVYQVNQTDDDVATAINLDMVMELDMEGKRAVLQHAVIRFKRESSGNLSWSVARNGSTVFGNARTIAMTNTVGTDTYIRETWNTGAILGDHFSLRIQNNETGQGATLSDLGLRVSEVETDGAVAD